MTEVYLINGGDAELMLYHYMLTNFPLHPRPGNYRATASNFKKYWNDIYTIEELFDSFWDSKEEIIECFRDFIKQEDL